jgi:hypothetical protein
MPVGTELADEFIAARVSRDVGKNNCSESGPCTGGRVGQVGDVDESVRAQFKLKHSIGRAGVGTVVVEAGGPHCCVAPSVVLSLVGEIRWPDLLEKALPLAVWGLKTEAKSQLLFAVDSTGHRLCGQ